MLPKKRARTRHEALTELPEQNMAVAPPEQAQEAKEEDQKAVADDAEPSTRKSSRQRGKKSIPAPAPFVSAVATPAAGVEVEPAGPAPMSEDPAVLATVADDSAEIVPSSSKAPRAPEAPSTPKTRVSGRRGKVLSLDFFPLF